jgi:putative Mg2+ transporter-C (MgtC) family protein
MFNQVNYIVIDEVTKLIVALTIGAIIGAEREYRTKAAGFRTVILITVGSTLFTIISNILSNDARVASNIVTGIGFLGAGAIFKEGNNVKGLTTATTIWISAAIGMAIGVGQYMFAFVSTGIVLIVLLGFSWLPHMIEKINSEIVYRITLTGTDPATIEELRAVFRSLGVKSSCIRYKKQNNEMHLLYAIKASKKNHQKLVNRLLTDDSIHYFDV